MKPRPFRYLLWALTVGYCATVSAAWPTYEQAGFRHTALIYNNEERTREEFKPMIAYFDRDGHATSTKMFDTFLFLNQFIDGVRTENGETTKQHWDKMLEIWFTPDREVDALHQAAMELKEELGELPQPLQVIFCIPYPHPNVHDFGDVGTGRSLDFSDSNDVLTAVEYLTGEIEKRMDQYPLLKLQGFYWMSEQIGDDKENLLRISDFLHQKNYKFLWIPWFKADNWNHWKDYGFDCAIMQSNYAFTSTLVGGMTRANQIDISAKLSKQNDMGVEIEFPYERGPSHLDIIRQTFDAGTRLGFQHAPTAYFFSFNFLEYRSPDPEIRAIYDLTCDYINGKDTTMDVFPEWQQSVTGNVLTVSAELPEVRKVDQLDLFFDAEPELFHQLLVTVAGRKTSEEPWLPLRWNITPSVPQDAGRDQCITIPIFTPVKELQITIDSQQEPPKLRSIYLDFHSGKTISKLTDRPYSSSLPMATRPYNDSPDGRKLLDGITAGDTDAYIGWSNCPYAIRFDFGENPPEFDQFSFHFHDDPALAIRYPEKLLAFQTDDPTLTQLNGKSVAPLKTLVLLTEMTAPQRDPSNDKPQDATLTCHVKEPTSQRYLVIHGNAFQGWAFLSEAEFFNGTQKLDPSTISYELLTPPSRQYDSHADNGTMLTDGRSDLIFGSSVRVPAKTTATFTIPMADMPTVSQLRLDYAIPEGRWGERFGGPEEVSVQLNDDVSVVLSPYKCEGTKENVYSFIARVPETPVKKIQFTVTSGDKEVFLTELIAN